MSLKVDLRVPVGRPLPELADFAMRCEDTGFHGVGMHDHDHTGRDVYAALALNAARTSTLHLYPAASNPVTRHPLVLASLINSLSEIAPGRVLLSLAPGYRSVANIDKPQATRKVLVTIAGQIRALLAGETVELADQVATLSYPNPTPPEVFVLAGGPKMLETAGEIGDGVMYFVGLHPESVRQAREHVAIGARRAGRDPKSIREIFLAFTSVGDAATATSWPQRYFREGLPFLKYPSGSVLHWVRQAGVPISGDHRPEDISDTQAAEICDGLGLFGPAEHCADRLLRAREELGLEQIMLFPAHTFDAGYDLPHDLLAAFRDVIGPRVNG
jgi:5,10-methylenetetrahydromethanopterin reductase